MDVTKAVAPQNPLGDGAGELMLTVPYDAAGLSAELASAAPGTAIAIWAPRDAGEPVSVDNPAWLHWSGTASAATVKKTVKSHDPEKVEVTAGSIAGDGVAQQLAGVREKILAGEALDAIELTTAVALLLGVVSPPSAR